MRLGDDPEHVLVFESFLRDASSQYRGFGRKAVFHCTRCQCLLGVTTGCSVSAKKGLHLPFQP